MIIYQTGQLIYSPLIEILFLLESSLKRTSTFSAKIVEEIARKLGKEKGGEAGLSAGRLAGARAAVAAAKVEAAKVRYFIFLTSLLHISNFICSRLMLLTWMMPSWRL